MTLCVKDIMRKEVATCKETATVLEAVKVLKDYHTSTVVVLDNEQKVKGVFSERDLVDKVIAEELEPKNLAIKDFMTSPVITGSIEQTDIDISALIITHNIKKIPIVDENKLVGIIAESDMLKLLAESILNDR